MITPAHHAEIRRLFYAEHWTVGTIAAQLGVHHGTVVAARNRARVLVRGGRCRSTALDPCLQFPATRSRTIREDRSTRVMDYAAR